MTDDKCEAGCNHFHGGEIKHDINCVFYPESLTEMRDKMEAELSTLRAEIERMETFIQRRVKYHSEKIRKAKRRKPSPERGEIIQRHMDLRDNARAALSPKES